MFQTRAARFRACSVGLISGLSRNKQLNVARRLTRPFLLCHKDSGNCRSFGGCFASGNVSSSPAVRGSLSRGASTQLNAKLTFHRSVTSFRSTVSSNSATYSPAPTASFECTRGPTCRFTNLRSSTRLETHSTGEYITGFVASTAAAVHASCSSSAVKRPMTCGVVELSATRVTPHHLADSPRSSLLLRAGSHSHASSPPMTNPEAEQLHITNFKISPFSADSEQAQHPARPDLALIILNFDLPPFTKYLWEQAGALRICADGGANRLYDGMPLAHPSEDPETVRSRYLPDVIKGDLDSIRPEVQSYYESKGCLILNASADQDSTDLHKCIQHLVDTCVRPHNPLEKVEASTAQCEFDSVGRPQLEGGQSNLEVLVVGGLGGRVDHEFGNINVLHRFAWLRIVLLSQYCTLRLLPMGARHRIRPSLDFEGPHCGLIPVYEQSRSTTTTGLRWNLNSLAMSFGTLVSTSNQLIGDEVTVSSDVPLLWTTEVRV